MSIIRNLVRGQGKTTGKISESQGAITGTGGIATGLGSIDTGGAFVAVANAATTVTTQSSSITSISGGTVNVVVVDQQAAANVIGASAKNVNVLAVGQ